MRDIGDAQMKPGETFPQFIERLKASGQNVIVINGDFHDTYEANTMPQVPRVLFEGAADMLRQTQEQMPPFWPQVVSLSGRPGPITWAIINEQAQKAQRWIEEGRQWGERDEWMKFLETGVLPRKHYPSELDILKSHTRWIERMSK